MVFGKLLKNSGREVLLLFCVVDSICVAVAAGCCGRWENIGRAQMSDFDGVCRLDWSHVPAIFRGKTRTCLVARTGLATFHIAKLDPKEMLATWAVSVDGPAVAGVLQYYVFHNIVSAITHAEHLNQKFQADAQKIVAK